MRPHSENSGELIGQLRDYALRGSDDGFWKEPTPQISNVSLTMKLRGKFNDFIRVEFEAKKIKDELAKNTLKTSYMLKASTVETEMLVDFLPDNAKEVLRMEKVTAGDEENVVKMAIGDGESGDDDDGLESYDDTLFRHVRSVEYSLDEKGGLQHCKREDLYENDDAEGVEIVALRTFQQGNLRAEESRTVLLQGWGINQDQNYSIEQLPHPDLPIVGMEAGIQELREDIGFLTIVESYIADKKLRRYSQREHTRSMLTMLAFLNYRASTKDILELL